MPGDEETMSDEAIWETLPVKLLLLYLHLNFANLLNSDIVCFFLYL